MSAYRKIAVIRIILVVLIVLTLLFIWSSSLENAERSSDKSAAVVEVVKPIVDPKDKIDDGLFVNIVRKLAHFTEFALLGAEVYLLFMTFDRWKKMTLPSFALPIGLSFICAVTDELLQLTSDGRSCEFLDIMIDLGGIVAGTVLALLILYICTGMFQKDTP